MAYSPPAEEGEGGAGTHADYTGRHAPGVDS